MGFNFKELSILIVEDTEPMRKLVRAVLSTLGIGKIYTAPNGEIGYQRFCETKPDIVITDWHMQPTNGIELAQKIRKDIHSPRKQTPVIMMTGYSALPRIAHARDAGVTEFMVKPFSANDLARRIAYAINKPRDFIETSDYFGPDRRRRALPNYTGAEKRQQETDGTFTVGG
ncbi:MAG: response regulator [Alphaproteobacteria bacterium]